MESQNTNQEIKLGVILCGPLRETEKALLQRGDVEIIRDESVNGKAWIVASGNTAGISDTSGSDNWSGVIFQNGAGQVYGSSYALTGDAEIPSGRR